MAQDRPSRRNTWTAARRKLGGPQKGVVALSATYDLSSYLLRHPEVLVTNGVKHAASRDLIGWTSYDQFAVNVYCVVRRVLTSYY